MKIVLIVFGILMVLFIAFQIYTYVATGKSQSQPYQVVRTEDDFEIRYYPESTMATIKANSSSYKEFSSSQFGKLASYIFGGNRDKKQIAMTTPVHMDFGDSVSKMSFVMPSNFTKESLPAPNNPNVSIELVSEDYVAVISFDGFASNETIKTQIEKLQQILKENHLSYYGNFRYLGYNPPYQLFGRRNEIIVSIEWES